MTDTPQPVPPGAIERLAKIAYDNFTTLPGTIGDPASWEETAKWPSERIPWKASAEAVALAVCPPGHTVVRTDDLLRAVSAMDAIGTGPDDHDAYLRLRAKLKEQS